MNRFIWVLAALVFWLLAQPTIHADDTKVCSSCGQVIDGKYAKLLDMVTGAELKICDSCLQKKNRCYVCNRPVDADYKILTDGRILCNRDSAEIVASEDTAKEIAFTVPDDLNRLLSRYMTVPDTNVLISIVNRFYLDRLSKVPMTGQSCVTVFGSTATFPVSETDRRPMHAISLLSSLKKSRLMAVSAHEFAHTWIGENVSAERKDALSGDAVEGFCELVAYKYLVSKNENVEKEIVLMNGYTKGQVNVLLAADARYGFNTVVEWLKNGEDRQVTMADLDRIRAVKGTEYRRAPVDVSTLFNFPTAAPTAVPDKLTLKGISGAAGHRLALINDATFAPAERGKVRVGQTNVMVTCLEIRANSVLIQVGDSQEKQELFMRTN